MEKVVKLTIYLFIIVSLIGCIGATFQPDDQPEFIIQVPSPVDEAKFVWYLIKKIKFFQDNRYNLSMPDDEVVNRLILKSKTNGLSNEDWKELKSVFSNKIYDKSNYSVSYEIVKKRLLKTNEAIKQFQVYQKKWGFYIPRQYTVMLTLYGPGGSYNPNSGKIILMTTKYGSFKRSNDPLETILHEAVHIGIENVVIKKLNVTHWMKERIVDQFMAFHFSNICPGYRLQPNSDKSIDIVLNDPKVWNNLPEEISRFLSNKNKKSITSALTRTFFVTLSTPFASLSTL